MRFRHCIHNVRTVDTRMVPEECRVLARRKVLSRQYVGRSSLWFKLDCILTQQAEVPVKKRAVVNKDEVE